MFWVATQVGLDGVIVGLPLSALVTLPIVGVILWLDRWERERPRRLVSAFAWGASIAAFCAIWSQAGLQALVDTTMGTDVGAWVRPLIITPVTEEVFKGLFLVWLLIYRRRRITGLLDGIVYAGLVGAGFSFTENILYFGRAVTAFAASDTSDVKAIAVLGATFFLRVVLVPFMHPFFVSVFGLGIAASANKHRGAARIGLPVAGLLVAIALHGVWDWAGLAASDPFLIYKIYGAVMAPVFLAVVILALVLRRREGKVITAALPALARDGHIAPEEVVLLANLENVAAGGGTCVGARAGPRLAPPRAIKPRQALSASERPAHRTPETGTGSTNKHGRPRPPEEACSERSKFRMSSGQWQPQSTHRTPNGSPSKRPGIGHTVRAVWPMPAGPRSAQVAEELPDVGRQQGGFLQRGEVAAPVDVDPPGDRVGRLVVTTDGDVVREDDRRGGHAGVGVRHAPAGGLRVADVRRRAGRAGEPRDINAERGDLFAHEADRRDRSGQLLS